MKVRLFTSTNCPKCPKAKDLLKGIAGELNMAHGTDYEIINIDEGENLIEALKYQVASVPSFVIDEQAEFISTVPAREELLEKLR